MTKKQLHPLVLTLSLVCAFGCATPDGVEPPANDGPLDGADEVGGELPPMDPESPPVPIPSGVCITAEDPPYHGIRHHCGGTMDLAITGSALGNEVDQDIFMNFGPGVPGDSYEDPLVAACCGEYDFEQPASSQTAYWRNCLYDAVQQSCASLPHYLWDMAAAAEAEDKHVLADQLTKLGNDLGSGDGQYACIDTLFNGGPAEDTFNIIQNTTWNPAYDVWITIDSLEIVEVALPEEPSEWQTCKSIFENDHTVIPDIHPGPVWDVLGFDAGALALSAAELDLKLVPDDSSELLLGEDSDGSLVLGTLQLQGGPLIVEGVEIDRWRIGSFRMQTVLEARDGSFWIPAGALSLVVAVVADGDTRSLATTNASTIVLRETVDGWAIEPFSLVYTLDDGDAWTLDTTELDFSLR